MSSKYALNKRDQLRVEIVQRKDPVVVLSRWKLVGRGYKRTDKVLEFPACHLGGVIELLQRGLNSREPSLDAETITSGPQTEMPKRRRGGGRHRSLTPEQIEEGISILRNQPIMTVEAACATLREAGINRSRSTLYRLVIVPAYPSGY